MINNARRDTAGVGHTKINNVIQQPVSVRPASVYTQGFRRLRRSYLGTLAKCQVNTPRMLDIRSATGARLRNQLDHPSSCRRSGAALAGRVQRDRNMVGEPVFMINAQVSRVTLAAVDHRLIDRRH